MMISLRPFEEGGSLYLHGMPEAEFDRLPLKDVKTIEDNPSFRIGYLVLGKLEIVLFTQGEKDV